jgi:hypothetical protein
VIFGQAGVRLDAQVTHGLGHGIYWHLPQGFTSSYRRW